MSAPSVGLLLLAVTRKTWVGKLVKYVGQHFRSIDTVEVVSKTKEEGVISSSQTFL